MKVSSFPVVVLLLFVFSLLGGCATTEYTTHYGIFTAQNSEGEKREFRLYWQTIHYEGWLEDVDRPMPVVLETQCSQRKLYFYDSSFGRGRRCDDVTEEGIFYCTDAKRDMDWRGLDLDDNVLCGSVTDRFGSTDILDLEGEIMLSLNCRPKQTERRVGTKKKNFDFLSNSVMPYIVATKQVKGVKGTSLEDINLYIPEISNHSSICDPDG